MKAAPTTIPDLKVGDFVFSLNERLKDCGGHVVGFGIDPARWVRVKRFDGKVRIWARENLIVTDQNDYEEFRREWEMSTICQSPTV